MSIIPGIDLKTVDWKATMQLHLLRSAGAGLVWSVVFLLAAGNGPDAPPWWAMPFALPVIYFIGLPFYLLVARVASGFGDMGRAFAGFITLVLAIGIFVGDPLVYFLHKKRPDLVPVERFRPLNFVSVLFVQPASALAL